jgi:hypothetical protein
MPILGIMASQISGHLYDGPFGAYDSLATVTLSAATASVTFAGIPSGYKHLQIRGISKNSTAAGGGVSVTVNGDTTNYSWHRLYGDGSSASAYAEPNSTMFMQINQTLSTDTAFGTSIIDILDYANTNKYKTGRALHGWDTNGAGNAILTSGNWRSTSAITSITLTPNANFVTYTQFALYGVR